MPAVPVADLLSGKRLKPRVPRRPGMDFESALAGIVGGPVAGIDEAGRGPLAGPVVAAAVIFDPAGKRPRGLGDSKQLAKEERERLFPLIQRDAAAWGIGVATAQEIDLFNILEATRMAALRAVAALAVVPLGFVTDALEFPKEKRPVVPLVKGDAISSSIAAASILAKVTRDRMMDAYAEEFPEYNWSSNRGYPTADHYAAIGEHGPTSLHRMTFAGVSFFHEEPRRSPSFHRIAASLGTVDVAHLRARVEELRHRLPPPDADELLARIAALEGDAP